MLIATPYRDFEVRDKSPPKVISEVRKTYLNCAGPNLRPKLTGELLIKSPHDPSWHRRRTQIRGGQLHVSPVTPHNSDGPPLIAIRLPLRHLSLQAGPLPHSLALCRGQNVVLMLQTESEQIFDEWVRTIAIELIRQTPLDAIKYLDILTLADCYTKSKKSQRTQQPHFILEPEICRKLPSVILNEDAQDGSHNSLTSISKSDDQNHQQPPKQQSHFIIQPEICRKLPSAILNEDVQDGGHNAITNISKSNGHDHKQPHSIPWSQNERLNLKNLHNQEKNSFSKSTFITNQIDRNSNVWKQNGEQIKSNKSNIGTFIKNEQKKIFLKKDCNQNILVDEVDSPVRSNSRSCTENEEIKQKDHGTVLEEICSRKSQEQKTPPPAAEQEKLVENLLRKCQNSENYVPVKEKLVLFESLCKMGRKVRSTEDVSTKLETSTAKRAKSLHDLSNINTHIAVREICKYFENKTDNLGIPENKSSPKSGVVKRLNFEKCIPNTDNLYRFHKVIVT